MKPRLRYFIPFRGYLQILSVGLSTDSPIYGGKNMSYIGQWRLYQSSYSICLCDSSQPDYFTAQQRVFIFILFSGLSIPRF
jgi:hypothetical protein